jgi:hypothetical protein
MRIRDPTYAGKTYTFSVDNGVVFHNAYSPDGAMLHYETVAGPTSAASEDVAPHAAEVAPGVLLLGWVEKSLHDRHARVEPQHPYGPRLLDLRHP